MTQNTPRVPVEIQNYDDVYTYYESDEHIHHYDGQHRIASRALHFMFDRGLEPRLSYSEGAKEGVAEALDQGMPVLILANHVSNADAFVASAALKKDPGFADIIRQNRLWTVAKTSLFSGVLKRMYSDSRNLIPAFRPKDYSSTADTTDGMGTTVLTELEKAKMALDRRLNDREVYLARKRLGKVVVKHFTLGNALAIFPEGTLNEGDPTQIMSSIDNTAAQNVVEALKIGVPGGAVGLVTAGIYYGPNKRLRRGVVHLQYSTIADSSVTRPMLHTQMKSQLQSAVDGAIVNY